MKKLRNLERLSPASQSECLEFVESELLTKLERNLLSVPVQYTISVSNLNLAEMNCHWEVEARKNISVAGN
ncbi:hypothetical protein CHUAL_012009 [Chamberlinius hualienensis]